MDVTIRQIIKDEISTYSAVLQDASEWIRETQGIHIWSAEHFSPSHLLDAYPLDTFWAGFLMDKLVVTAVILDDDPLFWPEDKSKNALYLHKLAVVRPYHGMGLATQLITHTESLAKKLGREYVRLDCGANFLRLREFYEKHGYSLVDIVQVEKFQAARYEKQL